MRQVVSGTSRVAAHPPPVCAGESEQRILARLIRVGAENGSTPLIGKPSRDPVVHGDRAGAPCTPGRSPQDTRPVKVHSPAA